MMRCVVVDTETTGSDPEVDRVIELGYNVVEEVERAPDPDSFGFATFGDRSFHTGHLGHYLINYPGLVIPSAAKAVHHITEEYLAKEGSPLEDVIRAFDRTVHRPLPVPPVAFYVAHFVQFDAPMLGAIIPGPWVCTFRLARHLWPKLDQHGLQFLRYELKLDVDVEGFGAPHRAMYDTICTTALFLRELHEIRERKLLDTIDADSLRAFAERPFVLRTVKFGKWRDTLWSEVPREYLNWMLKEQASKEKIGETAWDADTLHTVRHHYYGGLGL